jgi:hypothetical protein
LVYLLLYICVSRGLHIPFYVHENSIFLTSQPVLVARYRTWRYIARIEKIYRSIPTEHGSKKNYSITPLRLNCSAISTKICILKSRSTEPAEAGNIHRILYWWISCCWYCDVTSCIWAFSYVGCPQLINTKEKTKQWNANKVVVWVCCIFQLFIEKVTLSVGIYWTGVNCWIANCWFKARSFRNVCVACTRSQNSYEVPG